MLQEAAGWIVLAAGVYVAVAAVFALLFAFSGVDAVEPKAREATWGFRLLILPGSAAFVAAASTPLAC
jgi:hypothetical protein